MANTRPVRYDKSLMIKVDEELLDALDRVRKREKPELTRSDAVRRMIYDADKRARKK